MTAHKDFDVGNDEKIWQKIKVVVSEALKERLEPDDYSKIANVGITDIEKGNTFRVTVVSSIDLYSNEILMDFTKDIHNVIFDTFGKDKTLVKDKWGGYVQYKQPDY